MYSVKKNKFLLAHSFSFKFVFQYSFIVVFHPLHIVSWHFSLVPSFIAVPSLSLRCSHPSLSLKLFTSIFQCISVLSNSLPKPALLSANLSFWFTAVLPNLIQIHIEHHTECTYCGCTHSLATPSPVFTSLVVCCALHHTAVSRLINIKSGKIWEKSRFVLWLCTYPEHGIMCRMGWDIKKII